MMKKKKTYFAAIMTFAAVMGWNIYSTYHHNTSLSVLTMNNVEALASSEINNECEGCAHDLYICKYYGNWGGCLGFSYSKYV